METDRLYRVQREDLPELEKLLTECFRGGSALPEADTQRGNPKKASAGAL